MRLLLDSHREGVAAVLESKSGWLTGSRTLVQWYERMRAGSRVSMSERRTYTEDADEDDRNGKESKLLTGGVEGRSALSYRSS